MLFLSVWDSLTLSISNAFRTFLLQICELLYLLMIFCYNTFEKLGNAEILTDSQVTAIYGRIGLILGLFMVFRIAFAGISYLINPDAMSDKKNGIGGVIKKVVISIVLLGITPSLFRTAYQVQRIIIRENIIAKIIVGGSSTSENVGSDLSKYLFLTFYTINEEVDTTDTDAACPEYIVIEDNFERNFKYTYNCINLTSEVEDTNSKDSENTAYTIKFDGILAVMVGVLMLWTIFTFTISAGIRVLKLAYLQMIAPIPIMAYVIPGGEETLKKWGKQCASTYADFFLRVAMVYFVAYIFEILSQSDTTTFKDSLGNTTPTEYKYLIIIMIISMFYFIKKLPDLIKEIFPNFGGGDFSFKDSLGILKGAATFGTGVAVGGIAGMASGIKNGYGVRGKIAGAFGGFKHGIAGGAKTKGNIFKNVQGGMSSTRQARQRVLDKQMYKIDNNELNKEYQNNSEIITAEKAIKDEAQTQLLKSNGKYADNALIGLNNRINYLKEHIGENDENGNKITQARIFQQETAYKGLLDTRTKELVDRHGGDIAPIAENMQKMQNRSGKTIRTFSDVDSTASAAKARNTTLVRNITNQQYRKQQMQDKKNKIK